MCKDQVLDENLLSDSGEKEKEELEKIVARQLAVINKLQNEVRELQIMIREMRNSNSELTMMNEELFAVNLEYQKKIRHYLKSNKENIEFE